MTGCLSIFYSFYEWTSDQLEVDQKLGFDTPVGPALAAFCTGITYKAQAGPKVAGLAGAIGLGAVGITYAVYGAMKIPYGQKGWLFF